MDERRGIGMHDALPWRLPGDMAHFRRLTSEAPPERHNAVIMGRRTYESIPARFRPLSGRVNVVLTRRDGLVLPDGVIRASSLDDALSRLASRADIARWFVGGGGEVYALALRHPACTRVHLTRVHATFDCDAHLVAFEHDYRLVTRDGPHYDEGIGYTFEVYERA
jgi:dihydrofolate reductase